MTNPQTPAALAGAAAEAIRQINHRILNGGEGWQYPGDAYSLLGSLDRMAGGLPQALDQTRAFVSGLAGDGHLRSVNDTLDHDVAAAQFALRDAARHAEVLQQALARAHSAVSPLAYED